MAAPALNTHIMSELHDDVGPCRPIAVSPPHIALNTGVEGNQHEGEFVAVSSRFRDLNRCFMSEPVFEKLGSSD